MTQLSVSVLLPGHLSTPKSGLLHQTPSDVGLVHPMLGQAPMLSDTLFRGRSLPVAARLVSAVRSSVGAWLRLVQPWIYEWTHVIRAQPLTCFLRWQPRFQNSESGIPT